MEYKTLCEATVGHFDALLNLARSEGWVIYPESFRVVTTVDPYTPIHLYVLASRSTAKHGDAVTR